MSDFKYWVQGYDKELGEFSIGYKDLMLAWNDFDYKKSKVEENGGHVELIKVSTLMSFSKGE